MQQRSGYPWDGAVALTMVLAEAREFTLRLRIPEWCENCFVRVNGGDVEVDAAQMSDGYLHIRREWNDGDVVTLNLDMAVQLVSANPAVPQALGRVALQRGPLIYCVEQVDNGANLDQLLVSREVEFSEAVGEHGALRLRAPALRASGAGWEEQLYRSAQPEYERTEIVAVPYCDWDNRDQGEMRVWLRAG